MLAPPRLCSQCTPIGLRFSALRSCRRMLRCSRPFRPSGASPGRSALPLGSITCMRPGAELCREQRDQRNQRVAAPALGELIEQGRRVRGIAREAVIAGFGGRARQLPCSRSPLQDGRPRFRSLPNRLRGRAPSRAEETGTLAESIEFSVVVPVKDEAGQRRRRWRARSLSVLDGRSYEMIFVDDASSDDTQGRNWRLLKRGIAGPSDHRPSQ